MQDEVSALSALKTSQNSEAAVVSSLYTSVKLSAKETKWTSLETRTHPTFLENLISKYDFGPVKLPGLSRNGAQGLQNGISFRFLSPS